MTGLPLNINVQQILLHLFNFTILFGGLYFLLYSPVKKFMAQREATYKQMDEEAQAKLAEAEKARAASELRLEHAELEIQAEKQYARSEIEEVRIRRVAEAEAEAEKILANARKEAKYEKERILDEAQSDIAKIVTEATEKMLTITPVTVIYDQFLETAEGDLYE